MLILFSFCFSVCCLVLLPGDPCRAAEPTTASTTLAFVDSLRSSLAMDYGNPNAHLELAKAIKDRGDAVTAFCICEQARTLFGDDAFLNSFDTVFRAHIGDVLFHARRQVLQTAINFAPRSAAPLKELADLYAAHGEPAVAADLLKRAITVAPEDVSLLDDLRVDLEAAGEKADADAFLSNWCAAHPDTPLAWERRAQEQLDQSSDSAGALLDQAIAKFPDDGPLHLMRAQTEEAQKPADAQADYVLAARWSPNSVAAQGAAGLFFTKVQNDPQRAMNYYLAAYFLDPNFNDWESVDARIREAAEAIAQAAANELPSGIEPDHDALVVAAEVATVSKQWNGSLADLLFPLTTSDCPDLREASTRVLAAHPESIGSRPDEMLKSADPWNRAAAVSMIAEIHGKTAAGELIPFLSDPSILVRYTAACALLDPSVGGRAAVTAAMAKEPSPWLRGTVAQEIAGQTR